VAEISKPTAGIIRSMLDLSGSRLATRAGTASATFTLFDHLGSHGAGGQHPHEGTPTHGSEHWRFVGPSDLEPEAVPRDACPYTALP